MQFLLCAGHVGSGHSGPRSGRADAALTAALAAAKAELAARDLLIETLRGCAGWRSAHRPRS
jgi:hypothetical protein